MWRVLCLVVVSVDVSIATRSYWLLTYRQKYGIGSGPNHAWMQIFANLEIKVEFGHKERYAPQLDIYGPTTKDSYNNRFIQKIKKGILRDRDEEKRDRYLFKMYKKYDCTYDLRCLLGMYSMAKSEDEVSTKIAEIRQGFPGFDDNDIMPPDVPPAEAEVPPAKEEAKIPPAKAEVPPVKEEAKKPPAKAEVPPVKEEKEPPAGEPPKPDETPPAAPPDAKPPPSKPRPPEIPEKRPKLSKKCIEKYKCEYSNFAE